MKFHKASIKVEVSLFLSSGHKDFGLLTPIMFIKLSENMLELQQKEIDL